MFSHICASFWQHPIVMGFGVPLKLSFPFFLVFLEAFPLVFESFFNHISLCLLNFGQ
jgi:hypothetical protein